MHYLRDSGVSAPGELPGESSFTSCKLRFSARRFLAPTKISLFLETPFRKKLSVVEAAGRSLYRAVYWGALYKGKLALRLNWYKARSVLNRKIGINVQERRQQIVISLTSYPDRFGLLHVCIESLMAQTLKPDKIVLYLGDGWRCRDTMKHYDRYCRRGLDVRFCEEELGSYNKLVNALVDFPNAVLITADDDIVYPRDWVETLYKSYLEDRSTLHCWRGHFITKNSEGAINPYREWAWGVDDRNAEPSRVFPTSGYGLIVFPGALHPDVTRKELFLSLSPTADDVWWKAMSLLNGVGCRTVKMGNATTMAIPETQERRLWDVNQNGGNDRQLKAVFDFYGLHGKVS